MAFLDETGLVELWSIIKYRLSLVAGGVAEISVTVKSASGTGIPGVTVTGVFDGSGVEVVTDSNGVASGYVSDGETTIGVSGYADMADVFDTSTYTKGSNYTKTLTVAPRNFLKLTASQSLKLSGNVTRVDVTAVGGGGGGTSAYANGEGTDIARSGAGGGGGYCTVKENVAFTPNTNNPAIVGAGGQSSAGGESSFLGVSANGGGYQSASGQSAAAGNGKGGDGAYSSLNEDNDLKPKNGQAGVAGSVAGYSSFTETVVYGGGGGSGICCASSGYMGCVPGNGAGYGGKGGYAQSSKTGVSGENGADGFGGGGGGGAGWTYSNDGYGAAPGRGGSGCIAIRMHLKVA